MRIVFGVPASAMGRSCGESPNNENRDSVKAPIRKESQPSSQNNYGAGNQIKIGKSQKLTRIGDIERKIAAERANLKARDKKLVQRRRKVKELMRQRKMREVIVCGKKKQVFNEGGPGPGEYDLEASDDVVYPSTGKNVTLGKKYPEQYDARRDTPSPAAYECRTAENVVMPCSPRQFIGKSTREDRRKVYNGVSDYVPGETPGPGAYDWTDAERADTGRIPFSIDGSLVKRTVEIRKNWSQEYPEDNNCIGPGYYDPSRGEAIIYPGAHTPALCKASKNEYLKTYMGKALTRKNCSDTPGYEYSDITSTFQHPIYKSTSKTIGQKTDTVKVYRPSKVVDIKPEKPLRERAFSWLDPDYHKKIKEMQKQEALRATVINRAVVPRLSGFSFSLQRVKRGTLEKSDTPGPIYAVPNSIGDRALDPIGPSFPRAKRCKDSTSKLCQWTGKKSQSDPKLEPFMRRNETNQKDSNGQRGGEKEHKTQQQENEHEEEALADLYVTDISYFELLDPNNEIREY